MADIHHVISLGLGAPADIPHFTLFGLSPNAAGGPAYGLDDLTTMLTFYMQDTLYPQAGYLSEDVRVYLDGVRASTGELDDLNTAVWVDLKV